MTPITESFRQAVTSVGSDGLVAVISETLQGESASNPFAPWTTIAYEDAVVLDYETDTRLLQVALWIAEQLAYEGVEGIYLLPTTEENALELIVVTAVMNVPLRTKIHGREYELLEELEGLNLTVVVAHRDGREMASIVPTGAMNLA